MSRRRAVRAERRGRRQPPQRVVHWQLPAISVLAVGAALLLIVLLGNLQPASPSNSTETSGRGTAALREPASPIAETRAAGTALGSAAAPVTIEIWSDFQCPFCGRLARTYLPRVADDFVARGAVRVVAEDVVFLDRGSSTESQDAAVAAECAGRQGRYWAYHDLLMWNQSGENQGAFTAARLAAMAARLGLDMNAWNACRAGPDAATATISRTARAATLGIVSTPTIVINGAAIVGLPPTYDALAGAIRQALETSGAA